MYNDIVILGTILPGLYKTGFLLCISIPGIGSLPLPSSPILTLLFAIMSINSSTGLFLKIDISSSSMGSSCTRVYTLGIVPYMY